jgi:hypothetical protein
VEKLHKKGNHEREKGNSKIHPQSTKGHNQEIDPIVQHNEEKPEDGGDTLMVLDD